MACAAHPKAATALQVVAWKKRAGVSNAEAGERFGVHPRTFARWLSGETESPRWLGDRFREGKQ